jgi:hypothetical protein
MTRPVTIGNASAFWGDSLDAPARVLRTRPDLDFLTLDYLAEVSLSIMAIQKEKDPQAGFAADFVEVVKSLLPIWQAGCKTRIVTNAGGLNPLGCASACASVLRAAGRRARIGTVTGDDVLGQLKANSDPDAFRNLETGEPLDNVRDRLVTANAYLGARQAAEALGRGADIVICGRLADPSLAVAAALAHYGPGNSDYDHLAAATVAGHLIECGTQVTGGISTNWMELSGQENLGFPIVELFEDGRFIVTKPEGTGGRVSEEIVKEQLVYELGDPNCYLSPDVTVSVQNLRILQVGPDRVEVRGARGSSPPPTCKVSATYRDGYRAEGMLTIVGPNAASRARRCGQIVIERMRAAGCAPKRWQIEALGSGDAVPGVLPKRDDLFECVLRVAVADPRRESVEYFARQLAPLVTAGPAGVTGYSSGRPPVRQVFGYWPCLIPVGQVRPTFQVMEV